MSRVYKIILILFSKKFFAQHFQKQQGLSSFSWKKKKNHSGHRAII